MTTEARLKFAVYRAQENLREFYAHFDSQDWYPARLYEALWRAEWELRRYQERTVSRAQEGTTP